MKSLRLLCLLLPAVTLTCQAAGETDLQKLQGRWEVAPDVREVLAANCQTLSIEIDAGSIILRSGELVLVTRYEVETPGPAFSLRQTVVSNNGKQNCYGAAIPSLAGQRIDSIQIDLVGDPAGDRLRVRQRGSRGSNRNLEMVRSAR